MSARITKQERSFELILSILEYFCSDTMTKEDYSDYVIQGILTLYTDNLKENFFHLCLWGGYTNDFPDLKKCMEEVDIAQRWGKPIIEEVTMNVFKPE